MLNLMKCSIRYVPQSVDCWLENDRTFQLPEATETEEDLLDQAPFLDVNSRLGCQLIITPAEEGLVSWELSFQRERLLYTFLPDIATPTSYSEFLCGWACASTTLILILKGINVNIMRDILFQVVLVIIELSVMLTHGWCNIRNASLNCTHLIQQLDRCL